jgi:hypothetical protein
VITVAAGAFNVTVVSAKPSASDAIVSLVLIVSSTGPTVVGVGVVVTVVGVGAAVVETVPALDVVVASVVIVDAVVANDVVAVASASEETTVMPVDPEHAVHVTTMATAPIVKARAVQTRFGRSRPSMSLPCRTS